MSFGFVIAFSRINRRHDTWEPQNPHAQDALRKHGGHSYRCTVRFMTRPKLARLISPPELLAGGTDAALRSQVWRSDSSHTQVEAPSSYPNNASLLQSLFGFEFRASDDRINGVPERTSISLHCSCQDVPGRTSMSLQRRRSTVI